MRIHHVTASGFDRTVQEAQLPFFCRQWGERLEFGFLDRGKGPPKPRYPDRTFMEVCLNEKCPCSLSIHLCGEAAYGFLEQGPIRGVSSGRIPYFFDLFEWVQINFAGLDIRSIDEILPACYVEDEWSYDLSLQLDGVHDETAFHVAKILSTPWRTTRYLHDQSGGKGTKARVYPSPIPGVLNGYAGGLSAENIVDELMRIEEVVGEAEIWIDFESGARDEQDRFCLKRVGRVLEAASVYFRS